MKSTSTIASYLGILFQNAAWTNVGNAGGLLPSSVAGSLYVSLHTADPGAGGDQTTHEATYTGYGRVAVARSSAQWAVATPQVSNVNQITFGQNTGSTETENYWGVGVASTGTGQLLYSGPITSVFFAAEAETSNTILVPGSSFSVNDRVAFFPLWSDIALPGGITEGTLYYVKTVTGDAITISATSGGTVITITSAGAAYCCKVAPFAINNGDTPAIAASTLVIFEL